MAITLSEVSQSAVRFVSKKDGAIDRQSSDLDLYYENVVKNADKLVLKPGVEPTYFVLNLNVRSVDQKMIKDSRTGGTTEMTIKMGSWAETVCRVILKDIINPANTPGAIEFKKDGRGYVDQRTLDKLARLDIIDEIWLQYINLTKDEEEENSEAKN